MPAGGVPRVHRVLVEAVEDAPAMDLPAKATPGAACFDLRSAESVRLVRGRVHLVRTGLRLRAPPGTFLEVRPRSGLGSKGVVMTNAPGTIDRDFAGEVRVPMTYLFEGEYEIAIGDRIAQVRVCREWPTRFRRGRVRPVPGRSGGFGSTGR